MFTGLHLSFRNGVDKEFCIVVGLVQTSLISEGDDELFGDEGEVDHRIKQASVETEGNLGSSFGVNEGRMITEGFGGDDEAGGGEFGQVFGHFEDPRLISDFVNLL